MIAVVSNRNGCKSTYPFILCPDKTTLCNAPRHNAGLSTCTTWWNIYSTSHPSHHDSSTPHAHTHARTHDTMTHCTHAHKHCILHCTGITANDSSPRCNTTHSYDNNSPAQVRSQPGRKWPGLPSGQSRTICSAMSYLGRPWV